MNLQSLSFQFGSDSLDTQTVKTFFGKLNTLKNLRELTLEMATDSQRGYNDEDDVKLIINVIVDIKQLQSLKLLFSCRFFDYDMAMCLAKCFGNLKNLLKLDLTLTDNMFTSDAVICTFKALTQMHSLKSLFINFRNQIKFTNFHNNYIEVEGEFEPNHIQNIIDEITNDRKKFGFDYSIVLENLEILKINISGIVMSDDIIELVLQQLNNLKRLHTCTVGVYAMQVKCRSLKNIGNLLKNTPQLRKGRFNLDFKQILGLDAQEKVKRRFEHIVEGLNDNHKRYGSKRIEFVLEESQRA